MTDLIQDKMAIVTGGASGLGLSFCEVLCRRGAQVIVADIDDAPAQNESRSANGAIKTGKGN